MAMLTVTNVDKYFAGVHAVKGISFEVDEGEFVSLLGPSGCGKTTTLRMVAGFIEVSSGTILIAGQDVTYDPPYRRDTGMVFQNYALFPHMTVEQNIAFGLRMRKVKRTEIPGRVARVLNLIQLSGYEKRLPRELSGGQQQRVALARALVIEPAILLLDEPLSNLDAKLREEMRIEIRRIQKKVGITSIFVTHDQEEALTLSDRIIVMNEGLIVETGAPSDIYSRPNTPFSATFIGHSNSLHGTVIEARGEECLVQTENGLHIRVGQRAGLGQDDRVLVLVRQERLRLSINANEHAPAANQIAAEVSLVTLLGPIIEYICVAQGHEFRIRRPNEGNLAPVAEGQTAYVEWDPSDCIVLKV